MALKDSPCKGCTERSSACWDKCPKDARGEYGYKAWKAEYRKQQAVEKEYKLQRREDWNRSEEKAAGAAQFGRHKNRQRGVTIHGRK